ncbi:MAG: hypothetical protein HC897_07370, partial [Thermoanaerobaculia bacterium]|nr:hypothetical protein [Thermoanaerobaculia bacterium]
QGQAEELIRFMVVDLRQKLDKLGRLDVLDEVGKGALGYFAAVPEDELSEAELDRRSQVLYQIGEVRIKTGNLAGAVAPCGSRWRWRAAWWRSRLTTASASSRWVKASSGLAM